MKKLLLPLMILALLLIPGDAHAQSTIGAGQAIVTCADIAVPQPLSATPIYVRKVTILAKKAARTPNVGTVYIGFTSTNDEQIHDLATGAQMVIESPAGTRFNLQSVYVDAATAGDGVAFTYM